jgi:hypothetical protein
MLGGRTVLLLARLSLFELGPDALVLRPPPCDDDIPVCAVLGRGVDVSRVLVALVTDCGGAVSPPSSLAMSVMREETILAALRELDLENLGEGKVLSSLSWVGDRRAAGSGVAMTAGLNTYRG